MNVIQTLKALVTTSQPNSSTAAPAANFAGSGSIALGLTEHDAIVEAFRVALSPRKVGQASFERLPDPPVPPDLIVSVARKISEPLMTPVLLAKVRELKAERLRLIEEQNRCGRDKILVHHAEQQRQFAEGILSGEDVAPAQNKDTIDADFQAKRVALKKAARDRSEAAGLLFKEAAAPVIVALRAHAEAAAVEEYRTHSKYGLAYSVSPLIRTLNAAASFLERQADRYATGGVALGYDIDSMFALIGIEL